jgi:ATP phosphoribosyltransferase
MNGRLLIALPKGRLFDRTLDLFSQAGISVPATELESRRLTFCDVSGQYEFVALKPVDVPVYVESGAVDAGVVGSDILRESDPDVFEPLDLRIGMCQLVVATPATTDLTSLQHIHIATKYPRTTERFFGARNIHPQIFKLEGSVEIAPILGLADAIVDLVETGRTLRDNGLVIVEEVAGVSAKLIVNRTAMKTRNRAVQEMLRGLDRVVYADH